MTQHLARLGTAQKQSLQLDASVMFGAAHSTGCLLYTSDAADDLLCVDLGGRRIIKKKNPL